MADARRVGGRVGATLCLAGLIAYVRWRKVGGRSLRLGPGLGWRALARRRLVGWRSRSRRRPLGLGLFQQGFRVVVSKRGAALVANERVVPDAEQFAHVLQRVEVLFHAANLFSEFLHGGSFLLKTLGQRVQGLGEVSHPWRRVLGHGTRSSWRPRVVAGLRGPRRPPWRSARGPRLSACRRGSLATLGRRATLRLAGASARRTLPLPRTFAWALHSLTQASGARGRSFVRRILRCALGRRRRWPPFWRIRRRLRLCFLEQAHAVAPPSPRTVDCGLRAGALAPIGV